MEWMTLPLKRYAHFQGRSRRMEYWMFALFIMLFAFAWTLVAVLIGGLSSLEGGAWSTPLVLWAVLGGLGYLALLVPGLAVMIRRLHDRDLTGWLALLNFVPYIGGIIIFVLMLLPGTPGPNKYGPDPKDPEFDHMARVFS